MKCEDVRLLLAAYRRSEWEPEDQHCVNAHLAGCAACRRWEAEARSVGEQLRLLPTIVPPPSFRESVFAAIHAEFPVATQTAAKPLATVATTKTPVHALPVAAGQHPITIQSVTPIRVGEFGRPRSARLVFGKTTAIATVAALLALTFLANLASVLKFAPPGQIQVGVIFAGPSHYTADTNFPLVTSVIANEKQAFYVAQNTAADGNSQQMLFALDRTNDLHSSTPLLNKSSGVPLQIVALTDQELVWLVGSPQGTWSLQATPIGANGFISAPATTATTVLASQAQSQARALTAVQVSNDGFVLFATTRTDGLAQLQRVTFPAAGVAATLTTLIEVGPGHTIIDPMQTPNKTLWWTDSTVDAAGKTTSTLKSLAPTAGATAQIVATNAYRALANDQQAVWFEQTAQVLVSDNSTGSPTLKTLGQLVTRDAKGNITPLPNAQNIALTSVWREADTLLWRDATGTAYKYHLSDSAPSSISSLGALATLGLSSSNIAWAQYPASNDPTATSTIEVISG